MKKISRFFIKGNNEGSGLITVLAGVSFMVILAVIILTVSFGNVHMKQVDYKAKKNFYTDEEGLDDIYNGVGRDAAEAFNKAYADTLSAISNTESDEDQNKYYSFFLINFHKYLQDSFDLDNDAMKARLNSYINRSADDKRNIEVASVGGVYGLTDTPFTRLVIKDVVVTYTERTGGAGTETGYESSITTDLVIAAPYIYFFNDIDAICDYAMIGNKGIFFNGLGKTREIEGNLYAGIDGKLKDAAFMGYDYSSGTVYDGMNFYRANVNFTKNAYIVSKGDFNLCESRVNLGTTGAEEYTTSFWARNIRTVENDPAASGRGYALGTGYDPAKASVLNSKASLYIADDLELNERHSAVNFLGGDYYGYNYANNAAPAVPDPDAEYYETAEHKYISTLYDEGKNEHAQSSAIMLNATGTKLNVARLSTLMVAGRAYIDIKDPYDSFEEIESAGKTAHEFKTGESLAARYNQSVYLAPTSILRIKPNPTTADSVPDVTAVDAEGHSLVWDEDKVADFFGVKEGFVNATTPVKEVKYVYDNGGTPVTYTYFFLNFAEGQQAGYLRYILNSTEPPAGTENYAYTLKQRLIKGSANADMTVTVGSTDKIYSNTGFIADSAGEVTVDSLSLPAVYENSTNLGKQYINLYSELNPAMSVTLSELGTTKYADAPAARYVYLDRISSSTKEKIGSGYQVLTMVSGNISTDVKGIVLCKEDLTIDDGVTVEGMVIAGGKIIVNGAGAVKANRAVVEKILDEERKNLSMMSDTALNANPDYKRSLASFYFKSTSDESGKIKGYQKESDISGRIVSNQYTDYVYFENWRKGAR